MAISVADNMVFTGPDGSQWKWGVVDGKAAPVPVEEFTSRVPKGMIDFDWVKVPAGGDITLKVSKTCVTVDQYGAFLKARPEYPKPQEWDKQVERGGNYAVTGVSWFDAQEFCKWAGVVLPRPLEWHVIMAGRDGKRKYPWGNEEPTPNRANYWGDGRNKQIPVACLPDGDTPEGVADGAGNVWEWCD